MKYLSGSQESPFNEGFLNNVKIVIFNKKYRDLDEKHINWKKRLQYNIKYKDKIQI